MDQNINIKPFLDYLSEKVVYELTKNLSSSSRTSSPENVRKEEDKSYSPTSLSKETGYSKSSIYSMLRNGLPYYQIGSKKMIRIQEFKDFITRYRVEIPHKEESYEEFETRIRKGKKLGDKLWREFEATSNPKTLSQFSLWLFENNNTSTIKNVIISNQFFN